MKDNRPQSNKLVMFLSGAGVLAASLLFLIWLGYWMSSPRFKGEKMNIAAFSRLPVMDDGRVKPMDSLARNSARSMSGSFYERVKNEDGKRTQAIEWLLDTITASPAAKTYKLFKIDTPEVVEVLGLDPRPGDWCYSIDEIGGRPLAVIFRLESPPEDLQGLQREFMESKYGEFVKEAEAAAALRRQKKPVTEYQQHVLKLADRLEEYRKLIHSFEAVKLPSLPSREEADQDPLAQQRWQQEFQRVNQQIEAIRDDKPVYAVAMAPNEERKERWQPYAIAMRDVQMDGLKKQVGAGEAEPDQPTVYFYRMLEGYRAGDAAEFNDALNKYHAELAKHPPADYSAFKVNLEARFNGVSPFFMGMFTYVLAFLVAVMAIPVWILVPPLRKPLNWTSFTLVLLTLMVHTLALGLRIYISGRPPVTTLYSSAIFIGWAGVIMFLVVELIFRLGIGNLVASVIGFATLFIAYLLAQDGETMPQLAAVLDTQFWLATHVVCITLGYAATFAAGFAAIGYLLMSMATPIANREIRKALGMIVYGIVCFAILFSFVGTVLGGLWADDSWGRFWGWDPKENGALIIVLWNAVVLHARWGGLVKDRGLAVLAIGGNIVTAWSWFGVNQLGIGLHSYGFNKGLAAILCWFVVSQLVLIAIGLLPTKWWWSYAAEETREKVPA